jgi:hypothetical protein
MANPEYVASELGGVDAGLKRALIAIFRYVLGNLRFGRPSDTARAENLQAYYFTGRTASVANTEFSIAHGLGAIPYLLIPVLDLQTENQELVPLVVSRPADAARIYLTSSATDAPFCVLVEVAGA